MYIRFLFSSCELKLVLPVCLPVLFVSTCSSGASGGASKGPAVLDKRNQVLECPHCDRTFQQIQRYREHITKKHPEEQPQEARDAPASSSVDPQVS